MRVMPEYTGNGSFSVNYYIDPILIKQTNYGELILGTSDIFGKVLFFDGEIQITSIDFELYHNIMVELANIKDNDDILIIGDGDGGFTAFDWVSRAEYIERDEDIMQVGSDHFGADWSKPKKINRMPLQDFVPVQKYDVIFLAITDDFNRVSLYESFKKFTDWLRPNGRIVTQVGCDLDCNYKAVRDAYQEVLSLFKGHTFDTSYFKGFLSMQTFFCGVKK